MSDIFEQSFRRNMETLNLPTPHGIFSSITVSLATMQGIARIVETTGGATATMRVAYTAGAISSRFGIVGGVLASFYLGACVGSLLVATGDVIMRELTSTDGYVVLSRALVRHQPRLRISTTASQRIVNSWQTERERYSRENPIGRRENEIRVWNGNGLDRLL
jgi:hypothetical protein